MTVLPICTTEDRKPVVNEHQIFTAPQTVKEWLQQSSDEEPELESYAPISGRNLTADRASVQAVRDRQRSPALTASQAASLSTPSADEAGTVETPPSPKQRPSRRLA